SVWIHYTRSDPARFISAADVLAGGVDARRFEAKLVLVGATALGLTEQQATPIGDQIPGVEIRAHLLDAVGSGDLLRRTWWAIWVEAALLAGGGVVLILAMPALPVLGSVALVAVLAAATAGLSLAFFAKSRILFDAAVPILGLGGLFT